MKIIIVYDPLEEFKTFGIKLGIHIRYHTFFLFYFYEDQTNTGTVGTNIKRRVTHFTGKSN